MITVYKYRLEWSPIQIARLPLKRVLTIQLQDGTPCLWALVDTDAPKMPLTIRMVGTGTDDGCDLGRLAYIGTTQFGAFVLHWFYETPDHALKCVRDNRNPKNTSGGY